MENIIKKADVLIEALPYIQSFYGKTVVIKYGGAAMVNEEIRKGTLQDIVFMNFVGMHPVIVHGGGPLISKKMNERGKKPEFIKGMRVTDEETVKIVEETLSEVNNELIREINSLGSQAKGMGGKKRNVFKTKKKKAEVDIGRVGVITGVDTAPIRELLEKKIIPVIMPLSVNDEGEMYNINADEAASALAEALGAEKLVLITDVKGILLDKDDELSLIHTLNIGEVEKLIDRNVIQQGMIPKVKACVKALDSGVVKTHIIDGRITHSVLLEIFTNEGIGTEIVKLVKGKISK
ncbi:MAG: acetylglutamate kinase [Candidatus Omnitrophota bacterium]